MLNRVRVFLQEKARRKELVENNTRTDIKAIQFVKHLKTTARAGASSELAYYIALLGLLDRVSSETSWFHWGESFAVLRTSWESYSRSPFTRVLLSEHDAAKARCYLLYIDIVHALIKAGVDATPALIPALESKYHALTPLTFSLLRGFGTPAKQQVADLKRLAENGKTSSVAIVISPLGWKAANAVPILQKHDNGPVTHFAVKMIQHPGKNQWRRRPGDFRVTIKAHWLNSADDMRVLHDPLFGSPADSASNGRPGEEAGYRSGDALANTYSFATPDYPAHISYSFQDRDLARALITIGGYTFTLKDNGVNCSYGMDSWYELHKQIALFRPRLPAHSWQYEG